MRKLKGIAATSIAVALVLSSVAVAGAKKKAPVQAVAANAVIAIIDTGINPYHITFRDDSPRAQQHPSTYIPGYPKDAVALKISFDQPDFWAAVKKDCEAIWSKVESGKLYWFPGTKIIGGISFAPQTAMNCAAQKPTGNGRVLDMGGHGTMTASRATSSEYGACRECKVVAVQFSANGLNKQDALDSINWAADNASWVDAQSNSWGPFAPAWEPTGASEMMAASPELVRTVEKVSRAHLAFWASGNGLAFRWGALGHPTLLSPHLTPSAIMVGGHDSGYVSTWPGFPPHIVSDVCASWAAHYDQTDKSAENVGSGTSAATPFAAGGAERLLLEARRILGDNETGVSGDVVARGPKGLVADGPLADGEFTLEEWKRVTFVSATRRPKGQYEDGPPCDAVAGTVLYSATPVKWTDVPDQYPEYLHIGYGAVDNVAVKLGLAILHGTEKAPDRTATDEFFANDRAVREQLYEIWSKP